MGLYTGSRSRGQRERTNPVIFPLPLGKSSVQKPRCPRETYLPRAVRCACPRKDTATGFPALDLPSDCVGALLPASVADLGPGSFSWPRIATESKWDPHHCCPCFSSPKHRFAEGRCFFPGPNPLLLQIPARSHATGTSLLPPLFFSTQHHLPIHSLKPFMLAISFLAVQSTPVQPLL